MRISENKRHKPVNKFSYYTGNNYGLKSKEPVCAFPSRAAHCKWAQGCAFKSLLLRLLPSLSPLFITTSVHFAVEKLGEIDDELVLARPKREVENALDVEWFYEHLHECGAKQCRYVISNPCARRKGQGKVRT
jgi:hypothetical protein